MSGIPSALVSKLWNDCHILGTTIFPMAATSSRAARPSAKPSAVPAGFDWPSLLARDGDELETHYRHVLETLGKG